MSNTYIASRLPAKLAKSQIDTLLRVDAAANAKVLEAKALLQEVLNKSAVLKEQAAQMATDRDAKLSALADSTVDKFLDVKRIEAEATAGALLIRNAGQIRQDFENLTPWLGDFLRTAVDRIFGELNESELMARLVREGIAAHRDGHALTLSANANTINRAEAARAMFPADFEAIKSYVIDEKLDGDAVRLDGPGGFVEAGLTTQLDALVSALDTTS